MLECDVFVIGCGPAGASLAYYLAQKNIKVIVAEKKKNLDMPVRCAGFVPVNIAGLFDFKIGGINNQTEFLETYAAKNPSEKFHLISKISAPGFILDRDTFVSDIASRFTAAGGKLLKSTRVLSIQQSPYGFTSDLFDMGSKNHLMVKARIIAGADGPLSLVGRLNGSVNKSFMTAIQQNPSTMPKSADCNKVFFSPYISCGYGWLFPKTKSINLGVGAFYEHKTMQSDSIKNILSLFIRHLEFSGIFAGNLNPVQYNNKENKYHLFPDDNKGGIKQAKSLETYNQFTQTVTGLIPDSGIVENPGSKDGFILCGDAAGLCNPITGAGIFNAIYSAKLASESIAKSLGLNDLNILQGIKEIYNSQFGNSINLALRKKLMQKDNWPKPVPDLTTWQSFNYKDTVKFSDLIRQTWIAFRDYWH